MRMIEWVRDRPKVGRAIITIISAVVVIVCIAALLWLNDLWPERLIPWVPVERL